MDSVKAEKQRAMLRYHRLRQAAAISRWLLEAVAALAILSWSSDRLTAALAVCAALLRRLPAVLFHPASAFLVGNVIVVTLFAKSGGQSSKDHSSSLQPSPSDAGDAHDQRHCYSYFSPSPPPQRHRDEEKEEEEEEEEEEDYEDKAVCLESTYPSTAMTPTTYIAVPTTASTTAPTGPNKGSQKYLPLSRTRSSALPAAAGMVSIREKLLRRSETDVGGRRSVAERWWWPEEDDDAEEEGGGRKAAVAEDDNEEFRRRIEAFISKQLRFIEREEESLLLAANGAVAVAVGGPDHHRRR